MSRWPAFTVAELQRDGVILVEDGNHGEYRPRPNEFIIGGTAFIRAADITDGEVRFADAGGIDDVALKRVRKGIGRPGDILFSHKGTVGKLARVPLSSPPFVCSPQTTFWRVLDGNRLCRDYLYAFMRSRAFIDQWSARKGETDMADYVSLTAQRQLKVTVPPIEFQRRIAAPLAALDDLIDNSRRRTELLEQIVQIIYREWFVRFRYPGYEDVALIDSPLGTIPEGWDVLSASELLAINPRLPVDKTSGHPFVTMGDVSEQSMICFPSDTRFGSSGSKFQNGDILFARITPCLENGKTACVRSLASGETGRGSTEFIVLRGRRVGSAFTYMLAREDNFRAHAIQSMSGASGRQRVRNECFDSYMIAAPPAGLAEKFEQVAEPLVAMAYSLARENRSVTSLRDLLLPKLVSGHIDVSRLDFDALVDSFA